MNRIVAPAAVGAAIVTVLAAGVAAPAFAAAAPRTLATVQVTASSKAAKVTDRLTAAVAKVNANANLTASDKAAILGVLNADLAALRTGAEKVAADTTKAAAVADLKSMVATARSSAVARPQARLVAAADRLSGTVVPKLTAEQGRLAGRLSGADAAKSTPQLQSALSDMTVQIGTASAALNGLSARVLAVTPEAYRADRGVLATDRAALKTARTALRAAAKDGKTVSAALK